jgi:MinD-like ATPase involved in chromosome partitioning or flagellar assembly
MGIETKVEKVNPLTKSDVLLAQGVPVISIMGAKGAGKTTSAVLIALGLKKHGKAVYFINLDELAKLPDSLPFDEEPDYIVINFPPDCCDGIIECAPFSTFNILVVSDIPRSITKGYEILKRLSREKSINVFYCLSNQVRSKQEGFELLMKLRRLTDQFLDSCLENLGTVMFNMDIAYCGNVEYSKQSIDKAVLLYEDVVLKLLKLHR